MNKVTLKYYTITRTFLKYYINEKKSPLRGASGCLAWGRNNLQKQPLLVVSCLLLLCPPVFIQKGTKGVRATVHHTP